MSKTRVGIVGCGNISGIYFKNLTGMFPAIEISGCSDLDKEKAEEKGKNYGVPVYSTDELMKREDVDIILNLTTPPVHGKMDKMALENGKHVYSEKPFALDKQEAAEVLALAKERNLRVGCAPDTFLGSAFQTCRRLIDEGKIGKPLSVFASMVCSGHESWHPAPDFYYKPGGGPMLDMGPYYLTVLVSMLGPVESVQAITSMGWEERTCTSRAARGKKIKVETPTLYQGLLRFQNQATGSMIMSFDTFKSELPHIEIHGTEGSLLTPDPNAFNGTVKLFQKGGVMKKISTRAYPYKLNSRGVGVADMAEAIKLDRPHRANGEMAVHVLDVMLAFEEAGKTRGTVKIESPMERREPLPMWIKKGEVS